MQALGVCSVRPTQGTKRTHQQSRAVLQKQSQSHLFGRSAGTASDAATELAPDAYVEPPFVEPPFVWKVGLPLEALCSTRSPWRTASALALGKVSFTAGSHTPKDSLRDPPRTGGDDCCGDSCCHQSSHPTISAVKATMARQLISVRTPRDQRQKHRMGCIGGLVRLLRSVPRYTASVCCSCWLSLLQRSALALVPEIHHLGCDGAADHSTHYANNSNGNISRFRSLLCCPQQHAAQRFF